MNEPADLGDFAERILTYLHLCEETKPHPRSVPLHHMDGAIATDLDLLAGGAAPWMVRTQPGTPRSWPVDVRTVCGALGDGWLPGTLQFMRCRTCSAAEARKLGATRYGTRFVVWEAIATEANGAATTNTALCCLQNGRWVSATSHAAPRLSAHLARAVPVALGLAASIRSHWTVWLGFGEGPRVRFVTDPVGARAAFRLRDAPPGRSRRAALLHWVKEHTRRSPRSLAECEEARIWIERYLRGATDFTWNGLRCRIQPADADIERLAA